MINYNLPPECQSFEPLHTLIGVLSVWSCLDADSAKSAPEIKAALRAWWMAQDPSWRNDLLVFLQSESKKSEEMTWAQPLLIWCTLGDDTVLQEALRIVARRCL